MYANDAELAPWRRRARAIPRLLRHPTAIESRLLNYVPALRGPHARLHAALAASFEIQRLWVGDSHAAWLAGAPLRRIVVRRGREVVVWLGPRLMYSVARDGFPRPLVPELDHRRLRVRSAVLVVTLGEIDCRVHLVRRLAAGAELDFVGRYVNGVDDLRNRLGISRAILVGPVPPSDIGRDDPNLPRTGSIADRAAATERLETALTAEIAARSDGALEVVRLTDLLADPATGALAAQYTADGCHVNAVGAALVRRHIDHLAGSIR